jgi:sulfate/thiosulfate-binding protein
MKFKKIIVATLVASLAVVGLTQHAPVTEAKGKKIKLLNVSYDPTRELYKDINVAFAKSYKSKTGDTVTIEQSHGGSGSQSRKVIDGLNADVVTLALEQDVNAISDAGLIKKGWIKKLKNNSAPYTSTIVLMVRKGNPKNIKDWNDLTKKGIKVITPNPKTSGGARWNFLAAYDYALHKYDNKKSKAKSFVKKLYKNVTVLDSGARASTNTFVQNGIGDVLIAWENEALLTLNDPTTKGKGFEIVYPSRSILAEPSVAVVDENAKKNKTTKVAKAYLKYLYTKKAQEVIAKNYYRPRNATILKKYVDKGLYKDIPLSTIADFGGWSKAQKKFFDDGGMFDSIYN